MESTFKFIHCADLHLGSRFKGVSQEDPQEGARMRRATFGSFDRICEAASEEGADFMVVSGDLYDDSYELPSTRAWLADRLGRLGIPVFICRGNHDPRTSWDDSIPYPSNVIEFGTSPERHVLGPAEVVGVSFSEPHEARNLASMLRGTGGMFTVACLHCDVDAVSEGYPYAPCRLSDLSGRGVDYWALGHIHKRQVVSTSPYVVYPGNIQGCSIKESGEKGAYMVSVDHGRVADLRFIPTQGIMWCDVSEDISGKTLNTLAEALGGRIPPGSVARITLKGSGGLDRMLRSEAGDVTGFMERSLGCTVSELRIGTSPEIDMDACAEGRDMAGAVVRSGRRLAASGREAIIDAICTARMAGANRGVFESMADEELARIVEDATGLVLARMGESR